MILIFGEGVPTPLVILNNHRGNGTDFDLWSQTYRGGPFALCRPTQLEAAFPLTYHTRTTFNQCGNGLIQSTKKARQTLTAVRRGGRFVELSSVNLIRQRSTGHFLSGPRGQFNLPDSNVKVILWIFPHPIYAHKHCIASS